MPNILELELERTKDDGTIVTEKRQVPVATESELLEFANRVRDAGGAGIIEALLPSKPGIAEQCLLANALNFDCVVRGPSSRSVMQHEDGSYVWVMVPQRGNRRSSNLLAEELARELDLEITWDTTDGSKPTIADPGLYTCEIVLPKHIGNAAAAFDQGVAFRKFVQESE